MGSPLDPSPLPPEILVTAILRELKQLIPGFNVVRKRDSWVCRWVIAPILWCAGRRTFLDGEAAFTPRRTVYTAQWLIDKPRDLASLLVHEGDHPTRSGEAARCAWARGVAWAVAYLFPQILVAFPAFVAVGLWVLGAHPPWVVWAVLAVLGLVALAPWPAPFRAAEEAQSYGVEIGFDAWVDAGFPGPTSRPGALPLPPQIAERSQACAKLIAGATYYRASWDESATAAQIEGHALDAFAQFCACDAVGEDGATVDLTYIDRVGAAVRGACAEYAAATKRIAAESTVGIPTP